MPTKQRLLALLLVSLCASRLHAQGYSRLDLGGSSIEVGGEGEKYARLLQVAGLAPLTPWSIEPFSPAQVQALRPTGAHPWASLMAGDSTQHRGGLWLLRPSAQLVGNTTYPFQVSNGPTWDGRGLTGQVQAGVAGHWGPLYLQAAPLAFLAQNASFPLAPNGFTDNHRFADPRFPLNIDAPQRFGDAAYGRVTPGTSSLLVDGFHLVAGISTAPQRWGPEIEYPLVLGPNAGGFPNVFIGSDKPWNFWLFRGEARLLYGELSQSAYAATDTAGGGRRLGEGLILAATPRGVPGLEVGLARFIHRPWGDFSRAALLRPISGIINDSNAVNVANENQVASVFARWAFPSAKTEFFGEFYKEDYPGSFHSSANSLVEKPDDLASFALGFQHVLSATATTVRSIRGELVNGETSHQERLERGFTTPQPPYVHSAELQGHTEDGFILGSPEAYGGSGWTLAYDEYTPKGRRSVAFQRSLRFDWLPTIATDSALVHPDVAYSVRFDLVRFLGARELDVTLAPTLDLNRNLVDHHDVPNLTVAVGWRGW